jgi:hypothetical protein
MKLEDGYWQKKGTLVELMRSQWGTKTLESFRLDSDNRPDGGLWEAVRKPDGGRIAIMVCVTKRNDIAMFEKVLGLPTLPYQGENLDWSSTTLLGLFSEGLGDSDDQGALCAEKWGLDGQRSALIFLAYSPKSVAAVEQAFELTP